MMVELVKKVKEGAWRKGRSIMIKGVTNPIYNVITARSMGIPKQIVSIKIKL